MVVRAMGVVVGCVGFVVWGGRLLFALFAGVPPDRGGVGWGREATGDLLAPGLDVELESDGRAGVVSVGQGDARAE